MISRRVFTLSALASVGGLTTLTSCSSGAEGRYDVASRELWRHSAAMPNEKAALLRELVRYATLAPSSHNTQCWKFYIDDNAISILPDFSRRCPAVDPDDHHLFVSLGCAAENLAQAALAHGLMAHSSVDAAAGNALRLALEPTRALASPLFQAIPARQSTRTDYDGKPLTTQELDLLQRAGSGNGVRLILLTQRTAMENVLEYVVQGNTAQMQDSAFIAELKKWMRFNADDAMQMGDGLYSALSGNPSLPSSLGGVLFDLFFTPKSENDKYAKQVRSSAGIAVFVADGSSPADWLAVGRCYERFALQSAALDIRNAFLNQPVEVSALRPQFANFLGIAPRRPDLVVRFGHGARMASSMRRPVQSVLV